MSIISTEFIENMVTDNHVEFCNRWFHLAGVMEFLEDMKEFESISYQYNAPYRRFTNIETGLKEAAILDQKTTPKAIVGLDEVPHAVIFMETLSHAGLSINFEDYLNKGEVVNES